MIEMFIPPPPQIPNNPPAEVIAATLTPEPLFDRAYAMYIDEGLSPEEATRKARELVDLVEGIEMR